MRAASASALLLALCATLSGGCAIGRGASRAAGSFFRTPEKVKQPKDPVVHGARLAVTWIGHATALVQIDDKLILTDPVFTSTVGQFSKRLYEPGVDPKTLPKIDAVVVSHMHFDHLSLGSLAMIEDKVRMLLLPSGGTTYLTDFAFPAIELRRWQPWEKDGLRITAVPVDHVGYRYGADDAWMEVSYTGYVIDYHGIRVYFSGDTAYDQKVFVETAQRFPGIDLALLPIAPIEPRDIMRRFHVDPAEALQAFFDLRAKRMVPVHYGTFVNSFDGAEDELRALEAAKKRYVLGEREVTVVKIGEQHTFVKKGEQPVKLKEIVWQLPPPAPPPKTPPASSAKPKNDKKIPKDDDLDDD